MQVENPFGEVSFDGLTNEMSVRELVCHPLLRALGFREAEIGRDPSLANPFIATGSDGRRGRVGLRPDYLAHRNGRCLLVLDAKGPRESVEDSHHVQQAYSYAVHPEVRAPLYALCNGRELAVWRTADSLDAPALRGDLGDWAGVSLALQVLLAEAAAEPMRPCEVGACTFDYGAIPLPRPFVAERQSAKRHYGVHAYFTRQPYSVVRGHIEHFTQPGDLVLDPFGGSGVTAIEAMMLRRRACHVDINPLSCFIVENLIAQVDPNQLAEACDRICQAYARLEPTDAASIREALRMYPGPLALPLSRDADVPTADKLFSDCQVAQLGLMKHLIGQEPGAVANALMLCFSGLIAKINLTYHPSAGRTQGRGDTAAFRYYRHRLARDPIELPLAPYFRMRVQSLLKAKAEMGPFVGSGDFLVHYGSATDLHILESESVDYIYTDPPYGAKIPYLDLSAMWLAWLDLPLGEGQYAQEAIEGGSRGKTREEYNGLMRASIREMYRVLKYDRWLSFVYAHKDPGFWHMIVEEAERSGFEYRGAVVQPVGKESYKKRQRPFTVLNGQLIVHFYKSRRPAHAARGKLGMSIYDALTETIEAAIAQHQGATIEQINDAIIIRGLEQGFLHELQAEYQDLTPLLVDRYDYHEGTNTYHLKPTGRFASAIPLESRIRYYLTSVLRRSHAEGRYPTFSDLVLTVMPLLKNGVTPAEQSIQDELERIAHPHGAGWRLNERAGLF